MNAREDRSPRLVRPCPVAVSGFHDITAGNASPQYNVTGTTASHQLCARSVASFDCLGERDY